MKPKSWNDYSWGGPHRAEERFVDESPRPIYSGLLDANGKPLYRHPNPVGFETDISRRFK
jgi:hypothetical protein